MQRAQRLRPPPDLKLPLIALLFLGCGPGSVPSPSGSCGGQSSSTEEPTGGVGGASTSSNGGFSGSGGATGTTTSETTTSTGPDCAEQACTVVGAECGLVGYDCDGSGMPEQYDCGPCAFPKACGGSDINNHCGDKCLSVPIGEVNCKANGFPFTFAIDPSCSNAYKFVNGVLVFAYGESMSMICTPLTVGAKTYLCCP